MKPILLIVGGGIAAYKACELIRLLRKRGHAVRCVMTEGASHFVTAMTLAAAGSAILALHLARLVEEPLNPVRLLAFAKHPLVLGEDEGTLVHV